jgi:GT2 family glycosyltransferase
MLELTNRLIDRGHEVTIYLPDEIDRSCHWMRCAAAVKGLSEGRDDELDVLMFNHEPQWHLLHRFNRVRHRVFYALHYGSSYSKEGSWESLRTDVDLVLANSTWTSQMIQAEIGYRPPVLLGGISHEFFHPVDVPTIYDILAVGDDRPWKGTDLVRHAAERAGLGLELYAGKDLPQSRMAHEYSQAEMFAVGSEVEGFGQPGLEALACQVPLVTTDNGGCRDYAIDGQTALVVPPGDVAAMTLAMRRLHEDRPFARRLAAQGRELVMDRFDWDRAAEGLEGHLGAVIGGTAAPLPVRERPGPQREPDPDLTVVVLAWDQLHLTQRCTEAVRQRTDVPYELVIVDNGSAWEARSYASAAADVPVLNSENLGFAHGMNQGLAVARGRHVAFVNNDTEVPPGWASALCEHLAAPEVGMVVPAVTNANDPRIVRKAPGSTVSRFDPFESPPPAVLVVLRTALAREIGGWDERYPVASGEDLELAFTLWANGLDIVFDERVLVAHVSKGTAGTKLEDWRAIWQENRRMFLHRWTAPHIDVPRIGECAEHDHARNLRSGRAAAGWMLRFFEQLETTRDLRAALRAAEDAIRPTPARAAARDRVRRAYASVRPLLPSGIRRALFRRFGHILYR